VNSDPPTAWPSPSVARLAASLATLAERVSEPDVRAQLHALGALIENFGAETAGRDERFALEEQLAGALAANDEPGALRALRRLAALNRAAVHEVDWSAASGG
jgi:hypothetical protein